MSNTTPNRIRIPGYVTNITRASAPSLTDPSLNANEANSMVKVGTDYYFVDATGTARKITSDAPIHMTEVQLATAAQDEFTLADTPIGAVIVTRNGVDISDSFTWVGAVGTYDSTANLDCTFNENDKIRFHYETAA